MVEGLLKRFGDVTAVELVSFNVHKKELFGCLGPIRAGKTTTINTLTGLAHPDAGRIWIGGIECMSSPEDAQCVVEVVMDESNLYRGPTGFENQFFYPAVREMRQSDRRHRQRQP